MRRVSLIIIIAIVFAHSLAFAQPSSSKGDRVIIEQIIENWNKGWQTKDPKLAARDYSNDANWINAFGMRKTGRSEIEMFLKEVFSLPFVMGAESQPVEQSIRMIEPNVALAITRVERTGQRTPSGDELGVRHTSHLRVLVKFRDGWKIVSHLISDARDPQRSVH